MMGRLMRRCRNFSLAFVNDLWARPLYYVTMVLALGGAFLTSDPNAMWRACGFAVWMVSNGYMMYHFVLERNPPMILMFAAYEIFNVRGVINNL